MIGRRPRLVLAVVGGVIFALVALGGLILSAGGGARNPDSVRYDAAPASVPARLAAPSRDAVRTRNVGVDPVWAAHTGALAGIPAPAMVAYGSAQLRMDKSQPGCRLSWNTLAGIAWIESQHGTLDERVLNTDGTSTPPVIGPALNGQGFAAIRSTPESAAWHGDSTWEHAIGPLQFIRSSWDRWGSDGDGDGVANPMDLDDAAWTAARYLCADSHDLSTVSGWNAAVHSYNHDNTYVANVANAANTYAQRTAG